MKKFILIIALFGVVSIFNLQTGEEQHYVIRGAPSQVLVCANSGGC